MIVLVALAIGALFGAGASMMLERDLLRVTAGVLLIGHAANLFLMAVGLLRGAAPILPLAESPSDPLAQALTLTAVVVSFGIVALLLALVLRVQATHDTIDVARIVAEEQAEEESREPAGGEPAPEDPP